jgi:hypothetical protein
MLDPPLRPPSTLAGIFRHMCLGAGKKFDKFSNQFSSHFGQF